MVNAGLPGETRLPRKGSHINELASEAEHFSAVRLVVIRGRERTPMARTKTVLLVTKPDLSATSPQPASRCMGTTCSRRHLKKL